MKDTLLKKRMASESVTAVANPEDHKHCIIFQKFTLKVELYCSGITYAKEVQQAENLSHLLLHWAALQRLTNVLFWHNLFTLELYKGFEIWMYFYYYKDFEDRYSLTSEPVAPKKITENFKRGNGPFYLQKPIQE